VKSPPAPPPAAPGPGSPPPAESAEGKSPAQPAPSRVTDPFSVEEIEAEFARLLGRPFDKVEKS